jgi:Aspartyl protease
MRSRSPHAFLAAVLLVLPSAARGDWLQPDPSYREAQLVLRIASRDTVGHGDDPARLDSLGIALLRLARLDEAERVLRHSLAIHPGDDAAEAGLGKLALFDDRLAEAESLLTAVAEPGLETLSDLFAARVRRGEYAAAARMAEELNLQGRVPLLERLAQQPIYQITSQRTELSHPWTRAYPVPLVRVKLNGQSVLMALDLGVGDLLIDASAARRYRVERLQAQRLEFWNGTRLAVQNAMVQRLEIGGLKIEHLPAGILSLRKWSMEVNPQSEPVVGVIGLNLLRRFTPTLDFKRQRLELRPLDAPPVPGSEASRVPFQIWGESELMVYGSLAAGRRMALIIQTGVPACGVGAPAEVFDEVGVKPGTFSRLVKGAGQWLQGRPWAAVTVPAVTVGPVVKDKVPGWLGALDSSELWRHGVRRDALLSNEFFRDRRLTIDWKARELAIDE